MLTTRKTRTSFKLVLVNYRVEPAVLISVGICQNKKTTEMVVILFWQPQLDDFRTLLLRDYDEIVRNINALEDFLNGLNMSNVA